MNENSDPSRAKGVLVRLVCLGGIVLAISLWVKHHFGRSELMVVVGSLGGVIGFLNLFLGRTIRESLQAVIAREFISRLSVSLILVLTLAFLLIGFSYSSVTVMAAGAEGELHVQLFAEGGDGAPIRKTTLTSPTASVQWQVRTQPGGGGYSLKVSGFRRKAFEVLPWSGSVIQIGQDLERVPSVLLRLPHTLLPNRDKGRVELFRVGTDGARGDPLGGLNTASHGSVFFGEPVPLPEQFLARWELELTARQVQESVRASCLLYWSDPRYGSTIQEWKAGDRILAEFGLPGPDGKLKVQARATFVVGRAPVQDVYLNPVN